MAMTFQLHPDLLRDSHALPAAEPMAGAAAPWLELCEARVIDDSAYPWFLLVPRVDGARDTVDLSPADHARMWEESRRFGTALMAAFGGHKLNVAALGNMTPQLHLHHVVRFRDDPAWPGPIWGVQPMMPYTKAGLEAVRERLTPHL